MRGSACVARKRIGLCCYPSVLRVVLEEETSVVWRHVDDDIGNVKGQIETNTCET